MNDHSKDLKTRNLREAAIVLSREGFHTDRTHTDRLCVQLDGSPLCEVTESGGVAYRNEDIDEPERIAAKDKAYINYRRLSKAGVSKQIIEDFCNEVKSFVPPNTYFTMRSLRDDGFSHELEDLGFDDIFYAGILAVSPFFCFQKVYGNIVLYSGNDNKLFSIKAFIRSLLKEYDAIDIDDFMDDVYEKYGIKIPAKYDVTNAVSGTEMYCDSIMNKIYSNKALYYSDLDD